MSAHIANFGSAATYTCLLLILVGLMGFAFSTIYHSPMFNLAVYLYTIAAFYLTSRPH